MKSIDVAIIGAGRAGRLIAEKLSKEKEVLLIGLPGNPEDYFRNLIGALTSPGLTPPTFNFPVTMADSVPRFIDPNTLELNGQNIQSKHYVIASGCGPRIPENLSSFPYSTPLNILTSPASDASCTVVGAGPIGVCTAAKLAKRGTKVALISNKDRVLSNEDRDISSAVHAWLEHLGVQIQLGMSGTPSDDMILATGLLPHTEGMNLKKAGVFVANDGRVVVDEEMRTPNTRVHAAGSVTGPVFNLAYEDFQAETVAANIPALFFNRQKLSPDPLPTLIPLDPPIARIGQTEEEARAEHSGVVSSLSTFGDWRVKLVARKKTSELLGVHIFAPGADGLLLYFDLIVRAGIPLHELSDTIHFPSPGVADMARESIEAWLKKT